MSRLRSQYVDALERELRHWPNVASRIDNRGKHSRAYLIFHGAERFVVFPATPSDSHRGAANFLTDVRKELRELGAKREVQPRAHHDPKRRAPPRPAALPTITDPRPDGFAELRALQQRLSAPPPEPRGLLRFKNPLLPLAIALVRAGRSFGEAAKEIGRGLTRNAVAGGCRRAGVKAPMDERKRAKWGRAYKHQGRAA